MHIIYAITKTVLAPILKCFAPTVVCGKKRYKGKKPLIYVGNHLSIVDVIVSAVKHRSQLHFLGKAELMQKKVLGGCLRRMGLIPVQRGMADIDAMRKVFKCLKEGKDIEIFPEGTRNKVDNRLCKIYGGASMFAIKSHTGIIPFAFNQKAKFAHRNYMIFGDSFELSEYYDKRVDAAALANADEIVRQKMIDVKRVVDYLASLRGREKNELKRLLNDARTPFKDIFARYENKLFSIEYSVAPEDFDSQGIKESQHAD